MIDLDQIEPIREKTRIDVLVESISALGDLSRRGIIHRDLKPDNIRVNSNNNVFFIDMGLSVFLEKGKKYSRAGTPGFIAPELLEKGQRLTDRYNI